MRGDKQGFKRSFLPGTFRPSLLFSLAGFTADRELGRLVNAHPSLTLPRRSQFSAMESNTDHGCHQRTSSHGTPSPRHYFMERRVDAHSPLLSRCLGRGCPRSVTGLSFHPPVA